MFDEPPSHFRGEALVPVVLPYPPADLEDTGLLQRLNAAHADHRAALLQYHCAHAAAVLAQVMRLAREPGVDACLIPRAAVTHVAHHLGIGHKALERRPVRCFPGTHYQPRSFNAETHSDPAAHALAVVPVLVAEFGFQITLLARDYHAVHERHDHRHRHQRPQHIESQADA